jgi:hypothetical protein
MAKRKIQMMILFRHENEIGLACGDDLNVEKAVNRFLLS